MEKAYSPKEVEDRLYKKWLSNGSFSAKARPNKEAYSIVIPPPNVTGVLTMGHVLTIRFRTFLPAVRGKTESQFYGYRERIMPELPPKPKLKMRSRKWVERVNL